MEKRKHLMTHSTHRLSCDSYSLTKRKFFQKGDIPVIILESLDAKKDTRLATSSGATSRPMGVTIDSRALFTCS